MQNKFEAYIDSFEEIVILLDKNLYKEEKVFYLEKNGKKTKLEILVDYEEEYHHKYVLKFLNKIKLNIDYNIVDDENNTTILRSGSVIRCKEFEELFKYDGPLGVTYTKEETIFRIWSPVAKEVNVELFLKQKTTKRLKYIDKGLWEYRYKGDLLNVGYIYQVRVADRFVKINDPYAISSAANGLYNYVIDTNNLYKMKYKKPEFSGKYVDSIIYELSVRDFTQGLDNEYKGTFKGLITDEELKGINYVKYLGATHVQLLPTYDFGGVDDLDKDSMYNWGYNPEQYFIPCGWYSLNPDSPTERINELKELIDEFHKNGIRVNMDVVFNHVYKSEVFAFDNLVPGYFFRIESNGRMSNATGCGNVIATERYMARRFVLDVLKYYATEFNVSGFRFDLMGLIDVDTLNLIAKELRKIDKTIMLYGEGWNMINPLPDYKRGHMYNHKQIPDYAFFNDRYRDYIRGSQWSMVSGYTFGNNRSVYDLDNLLKGSCVDYYKFDNPNKSINYVECHDNYTFYDYGRYYLGLDDKYVKDSSRLALSLVLVSEGIPFIHAGEEFFRTKMGNENSYNLEDKINKFDYSRMNKYFNNVNTIRDLIDIRKTYDVLRLDNSDDIVNKIHFLDGITTSNSAGLLLDGDNYVLMIFIKNNTNESVLHSNKYTLIFNGKEKCNDNKDVYKFKIPGVYIFRKDK